jgi:hypothetical protein
MPDRRLITDRTLKALRPAPKGSRLEIWDTREPGFRVRVSDRENADPQRRGKAGKITFVLYGRFTTGRTADAACDRRLSRREPGAGARYRRPVEKPGRQGHRPLDSRGRSQSRSRSRRGIAQSSQLRRHQSIDEVLNFVAHYDAGPGAQIEQVMF